MTAQAVDQAVTYGTRKYGDGFFFSVKPHPTTGQRSPAGNGRADDAAVPSTGDAPPR